MRIVGGYAMTIENAKAWALRHCPGIIFDEDVNMISVDISRYWRQRGGNLPCEYVLLNAHEARVMFISHDAEDPTGRWFRHKIFREKEIDFKIKENLFNHEEDKGIFEFLTVPDPLLDPPYTDPPRTK